ncbi:PadR family transcriptional regulator [Gordonia phthalatica]|uniref:PadR family transcriptional regulator n=1 Tax=Gordonia phthalatica TaxID=1136941 RepID=A0A0N9N2J9_9ACTN|nr:PadR family transcriptional regulator [Gordonia phthalatica]ALG84451.1 PadR family transcriptional regulator [Gordonia phthalatica]
MALEHAILISLSERPGTGYEIGQQFSRSIGYFWSATHQQIYRTLKKLHSDGFVSFESVAQEGRPDKKVYTLSEAGRAMLAEWVASPTALEPLRSEIGLKLRAADLGDLTQIIAELREYRDRAASLLAVFQGWERDYYPDPDSLTGRKLGQYLVLIGGVSMHKHTVAWCDEVIDRFSRELDRTGLAASTTSS